MGLMWDDTAWDDYLYWQTQDRRTLKKLNSLIKDIQRSPFSGTGKPEPLKDSLNGYWSRRIDEQNRVVYFKEGDTVFIVSCRGHYDD